MSSKPKKPYEQGKNPDWQVPVDIKGVRPEQYPDRGEANPAGKSGHSERDEQKRK